MENCAAGNAANHPTSLGLDDELDPVELLMEIERAFALSISDEEAELCANVGDIYQIILSRLPTVAERGEKCATSLCFYRLRTALQPLVPHRPLRPDTPISVFDGIKVEDIFGSMEKQTGLCPPEAASTPTGDAVVTLMLLSWFIALIGGLFWGVPWWGVTALVVVPLVVYHFIPSRIPPEFDTFGALVRRVASLNTGVLAKQGARLSEAEAWDALVDVLANFCGMPRGDVSPKTFLMQKQLG